MSALDKQHGGDHYKVKAMQPVELWAALDLNGFQASIVKYITRHKQKNGAQDIDKAEHFFELMAELCPVRWYHKTLFAHIVARIRGKRVARIVERYAEANGLTGSEQSAINCALLPLFKADRKTTSHFFRVNLRWIRKANGYE